MPKVLPIADCHQQNQAHFVNFHGWEMPMHYGSQLEEHAAVRNNVGLFDVSHMTVVDLLGAGGRQYLRQLLANDVDRLTRVGSALYSCMLNHQGGIIDDLIVYYRAADNYRLVLNAATRDTVLPWLQRQSGDFSVGIQEHVEGAMIAIQGPKVEEVLFPVLNPMQMDVASTLPRFEAADCEDWFIARTGYTGEDGFEILLPAPAARKLWQDLVARGAQPCGLAARDTLRLEAGMMLSGQDMDESTTPFESALGWTVAMEPNERSFVGRAALEMQKNQGIKRQMVGLVLEARGMLRTGQTVDTSAGQGVITSAGFCPKLGKSIAFARVPKAAASLEQGEVTIRKQTATVKICRPRFYRDGQYLVS